MGAGAGSPAPEAAVAPATLAGATADTVLDEVRRTLVGVIGEDYVGEADIGRDTAFRADLDVESIEFVALGEALRATYGDRIALADWLAPMDVDAIIAITVGELVDHVVAKLGAAGG